MFKNMKLGTKLLLAFPVDVVSSLVDANLAKLAGIRQLKKVQIEDYFARVRNDLQMPAKSDDAVRLYEELRSYENEMHTGQDEPVNVSTDAYKHIHDEKKGKHRPLPAVRSKGRIDSFLLPTRNLVISNSPVTLDGKICSRLPSHRFHIFSETSAL